MSTVYRYTRLLLLALTLLHLGNSVRITVADVAASSGLVYADGASPVGGDFINMYAAAQLVFAGRAGEIYDPEAFMAFQRTLIANEIGLRLWAYPPHSLPLVWPLALVNYWTALALWSAVGVALLVWGARRAGFDWLETAVIVLCPAALTSLLYGQTGNAAAGLLLLALSSSGRGVVAPVSAALLTLKAQAGFLLPVLWVIERKFGAIAVGAVAAIGLAGLSFWLFGSGVWSSYSTDTLGTLNALEQRGSGPFMLMIPSVFMAARILTADPTLALAIHAAVAVLVAVFAVSRLVRGGDERMRWALLIAAMALITPYIHNYDLSPLVAAALIVFRRAAAGPIGLQAAAGFVVMLIWAMPVASAIGSSWGVPIGPLFLLALLATVTLVSNHFRSREKLQS